jgi:hypothetical protein
MIALGDLIESVCFSCCRHFYKLHSKGGFLEEAVYYSGLTSCIRCMNLESRIVTNFKNVESKTVEERDLRPS